MSRKIVYDDLIKLINDELVDSKWKPSNKFYSIRQLTIDQRGRVGEHFFVEAFKNMQIFDCYDENGHGDWDLEACGLKIEVKTATLDVNNKFQHEGIKENKLWDIVAFLDIAQDDVYVTFIHKDDFVFRIPFIDKKGEESIRGSVNVYGKKQNIHFRGKDNTSKKATGAGYKVDLYLNDLKKVESLEDIEMLFNECISKIKD